MIPASFDESNGVLDKPDGMTYDECQVLSTWRGESTDGLPLVVSCWKMTPEELAEVNRTGRVWLLVYGETMQPSVVEGCKPFVSGESS